MDHRQKTQYNRDIERAAMRRIISVASHWSASEQRIAIALVKATIYNSDSPLLVRKLRHETVDGNFTQQLCLIETEQFVGLRPEQQQFIERSIRYAETDVRDSVLAS